MNAVPARVAGVQRLVMVTPPGPGGEPHETVLAAAHPTTDPAEAALQAAPTPATAPAPVPPLVPAAAQQPEPPLPEATETILAFTAMCLWPQWFPYIAYGFAVLCGVTIAMRIVWGWQRFG